MNSSAATERTAVWSPGWYGLDQSLALGSRCAIDFFSDAVAATTESATDLQFYNQLPGQSSVQRFLATIARIEHAELGELLRVETDDLDYRFISTNGQVYCVNAEEHPGRCDLPSGITIDDWTLRVLLHDVVQVNWDNDN